MKLQRTQVLFTTQQKQQITEFAQTYDISFSAAVRELVTAAISKAQAKRKDPVAYLLKRAHAAPGGAPKDLGSNDAYLYGKAKKLSK